MEKKTRLDISLPPATPERPRQSNPPLENSKVLGQSEAIPPQVASEESPIKIEAIQESIGPAPVPKNHTRTVDEHKNKQTMPTNPEMNKVKKDWFKWIGPVLGVIGIFLALLALDSALEACKVAWRTRAELPNPKEKPPANPDVERLKVELNILKYRLKNLEEGSAAEFDLANDRGYVLTRTNTVNLLVSIFKCEPYLDGQRVYLNLGNPSSVLLIGVKMKVRWGRRLQKGEDLITWGDSLQTKEIDIPDQLLPGGWNPVSFIISPAALDQFEYLAISIETSQLQLSGKRD